MSDSLRQYASFMRAIVDFLFVVGLILVVISFASQWFPAWISLQFVIYLLTLVLARWSLVVVDAIAEILDTARSINAHQSGQHTLLTASHHRPTEVQARTVANDSASQASEAPVLQRQETRATKPYEGGKGRKYWDENNTAYCSICRKMVDSSASECPNCGAAF